MNLAQKYTDEFYATRLEIEKQMPIIGINALWNEILQYRNNFRKETMICGIKYSVVLTPAIQSWIKQTEQELQFHELLMHIYDDQLFDAHFFQLSPLIQCFFIYHIDFKHPHRDDFLPRLFIFQPYFQRRHNVLPHRCLLSFQDSKGAFHRYAVSSRYPDMGSIVVSLFPEIFRQVNTFPFPYPDLSCSRCMLQFTGHAISRIVPVLSPIS